MQVQFCNGTDYLAVLYQNKIGQFAQVVETDVRMWTCYAPRPAQILLTAEPLKEHTGAATGTRLTRILKQSHGCCCGSLREATSSHAIAMRHARPSKGGPGFLHILDANAGHFGWQLPVAEWPTIIDGYLYHMGYGGRFRER